MKTEPDWEKIEELAQEHADFGDGINGGQKSHDYLFSPEGLKNFVKAVLELNIATDQNDLSNHIHPAGPGVSAMVTKYEGGTYMVGAGGAGFSVDGVRTVFGSKHDLTQEPKNE